LTRTATKIITQSNAPSTFFHTSVSATPATIVKNTGTSTVTATVTGGGGSAVGGDTVELLATTASGSKAGCGSFSGLASWPWSANGNPAFATTDAAGKVTATYTAGSLIGACTITATEAMQGTSGTFTIHQVEEGYAVTVTASPLNIYANGTATSTIGATMTHNGVADTTDQVLWTSAGQPTNASCGTGFPVGYQPVTAVWTYTASATPGFCNITATEGITGAYGSVALDQLSFTTTGNQINVSSTPATVPSGGTTTMLATVLGATNTGIPNDEVHWTWSGSGCGFVAPAYWTTNGFGSIVATFHAGLPGTCTVTAKEAFNGATGSYTITVEPTTNAITVAAAPQSITANGITTTVITATVKGLDGLPLQGDTVNFVVTPTVAGQTCGHITGSGSQPTNAAGQATATYISSTTPGFCRVTATETQTNKSAATEVDQTSV